MLLASYMNRKLIGWPLAGTLGTGLAGTQYYSRQVTPMDIMDIPSREKSPPVSLDMSFPEEYTTGVPDQVPQTSDGLICPVGGSRKTPSTPLLDQAKRNDLDYMLEQDGK